MLHDPLPLLLLSVGIYVLIRIRFFYLLHPIKSFGRAFSALRSRENLAAFTLALAGTLGVGNVLGVAAGIMVGGAGSVFWLFLSAIPASAIKYAEVLVASDGKGGIAGAAVRSFGKLGRLLSLMYALSCLVLSLVMGAALQSRSVVDATRFLGVENGVLVSLALAVAVAVSVVVGAGKIGKITMRVIPLTTMIYILVTISVIISNAQRLPGVLEVILNEAFTPRAGVGGAIAFLNSRAMREGFARGMLSNEAGAGTSSLGHVTGGELPPSTRALHGVLEVVFDTSILCTLTALAVLSGVSDASSASCAMELVLTAVQGSCGAFGSSLIGLSVWAFAYSTVICWYYYGSESMRALVGGRGKIAFCLAFLLFVFLGAVISEALLITVADALLLALTAITLPTVIKNSDRIVHLSEFRKISELKETDSGKRLDTE